MRVAAILWACLAVLPAGAGNLLRNPSFEEADAHGLPAQWAWRPGAANGTLALDDTVARSGHRSVRIANPTPLRPHVYAMLFQRARVKPGETYTLSAYVRGAQPGQAWIGGGHEWRVRLAVPAGPDWQRVAITFTTGPQEREWEVGIHSDSTSPGFWVDDVQLVPGGEPQPFELPQPAPAGALTVALEAAQGANLLPNASFERLAQGAPASWVWDPRNTDAKLAIVEPGHFGQRCVKITNGTAFGPHIYGQLRLAEPLKVAPKTRYTLSFYCRSDGSPGHAWVGGATDWRVRARVPGTNGAWQRVSTTFVTRENETSIPLMINTDSPTAGFLIDDVQLEEGGLATPFDAPDTSLPAQLAVENVPEDDADMPPWKPELYPTARWCFARREIVWDGALTLPEPLAKGRVEVTLSAGGRSLAQGQASLDGSLPKRARLTIRYGLTGQPPEQARLEAAVVAADGRRLATATADLEVRTAAMVAALLQALEPRLAALAAKAAADDYQRVTVTVLRNFIRFTRDDLAHGAVNRAYDTARELMMLADRAEQAKPRPRAPRYVTSPLTIAGPTFVGTAQLPDGSREQRPIWFNGYGHFGSVVRDLEQWPDYGHNLIQVEFGPDSVLPAEGQVSTAAIDSFLKLCDRAAKANVQVNLLLSPHYFPEWALRKWPYLKDFDGGFFRYSVYAPEARTVIERSLREVIPRLKDHPALHSVCLSNEPLSLDLSRCRYAARLWRQWLQQRYQTVEAVNARWGTRHASFDAIAVPPPQLEATALNYDFTLFNQEAFAQFHAWMANIVRSLAPNLPVHAKIMMSAHFQRSLHGDWCIAPELFSRLSSINGNDCCKWPRADGWACNWVGENMGYDYQRSAADRPVFNSENHLIMDRDVSDVSPEYIQNVYWQGAIHGQGATTTWVWERTYEAESDFAGSLMHRPKCVEANGWTTLDLNRAAREVAAIAAEPFRIAVLWSQATSVFRGSAHGGDVARAYAAANFLDQPVGFINERDCEDYLAGRPNRAFALAKVLLVPQVTHAPRETVAALKRFQAAGGRVIWLGDCLTHDETGKRIAVEATAATWPRPTDEDGGRRLWSRLRTELATAVPALVDIGCYGVEARSAAFGGGRVLNLCNYLPQAVTVTIPVGCRDLLTGELMPPQLVLPPLVPRLVTTEPPAKR